MNIIIVGVGEIGRHLALSLTEESHHTVVIETDDRLVGELEGKIDAKVICSDGTSVNTLLEANVATCHLFFAVTSDDTTNLVACSIAKQLGASKAICRVHPKVLREEWLFDHRGHFGIDHIFASERLAAVELSKFIRNPTSLLVEEIARGRIELQQIEVSAQSEACDKTLRDLKLPPRVRVGSIGRNGHMIIPSAEERLQAGDSITLFGEAHRLHEIVGRLGNGVAKQEIIKVVIFGGGEYGFSLAQMLESWNCRVRIFESDPALCEELSHRLSETTVLNVDATSVAELKEEQVGDADFFVATTQSDEDNVMTCLQAQSIGAKNCLTLIHRADYADAISSSGAQLGIMAAVSPREATRKELARFITSDKYHVIKELDTGELIEASVPEKSRIVDHKVSEIDWPEGSGLVALLHGVQAAVPAADDVIRAGDCIYAMVSNTARKKFLNLISK